MRIIFFSDAHGNQYAVREFFRAAWDLAYDRMIFGGDAAGYYYGADEVVSMLREQGVHCLLGNHDRMLLDVLDGKRDVDSLIEKYGNSYKDPASVLSKENEAFLRTLEPYYEIHEDLRMVFVHGSVTDPLNGRVYPDAVFGDTAPYDGIDFVFCGHTHHKMEKKAGRTLIVNPGSIGQQRDGKGCTFLLFDSETRERRIYEVSYDRESLVQEVMRKEDNPKMRDRLIEVLYRRPDYREGR